MCGSFSFVSYCSIKKMVLEKQDKLPDKDLKPILAIAEPINVITIIITLILYIPLIN